MGHKDSQGGPLLVVCESDAQVGHKFGAEGDVNALHGGQASGHFRGTVAVALTELILICRDGTNGELVTALQFLEMRHRQLQYVSLLQLGDGLPFGLECSHHQVLEFVQALVDARPSLAFQHGLHHLAVLVGAGQRLHFTSHLVRFVDTHN